MKKLFALLLALAMITCLFAGCKGNEEPTTPNNSGEPSSESTPSENNNDTAKGSVYYLNFKPEFDEALTKLAATYTEKTGVEVKVVTAASGDYNNTLTANIGDITVFNIGNTAALNDWDEYALDLTDSAIAKELNTDGFNLYNTEGKLKAIGNCYESFGIIVNKALLEKAGYKVEDIKDFASLKKVAEDIHARASELGFDAFSSAGLESSSSWRFSGHLATLPLHYEGIVDNVPTITGKYLNLFKNVWDLYINNSTCAPSELSTKTGDESRAEFGTGKAVFFQNGTWEFSNLTSADGNFKMNPDDLQMIPIYCGADDDAKAALCSGTENRWAINAKASEEDQKASIDFLVWLVTDPDASKVYVEQLGAVPFKNCPASSNKFVNDGNALLAEGKTPISWAFNYTPNVDAWRATVVTALTSYSMGQADWSEVEKAFVDGWAYEYSVVNG